MISFSHHLWRKILKIFTFFSSSFACLEPKLDRLEDWSIFVGIWAIRSVAQSGRQQANDVCDYFWLNLSQCYLWMIIFVIWSSSPSPSLLSLPSPSSITNFNNPNGFLTIVLLLFAIAELNLVFKAHFTKIQNRKYKKYKHNVHTVFLHEN